MDGSSKKFELNKKDLNEILLISLLVGLSSGLTYIAENIGQIDFGKSTLLIVPIITVTINSVVRWLKDFTKAKQENKNEL